MRPVWRGIGLVLHAPAVMALLSLPVCAVFGEWRGIGDLLLTAAVAVVIGQALYWAARGGAEMGRYHAMWVAAAGWLLVSVVGALPYWLAAGTGHGPALLARFLNAFFESLSGFTSTGMTLLDHPAALPHYLQWWRSLTEWVGGVGIIVLMLSVLPVDQNALHLYRSEARDQKILPSVRSTVQAMWSVYLLYTVVGVGLLWLAGGSGWRAVNDGMSAIATGGFSISDHGLADSPPAFRAVLMLVMVVGATSFSSHYRLLRSRDWRGGLWGGSEQRLFWGLLAAGVVLMIVEHALLRDRVDFLDAALRWVEALTTSGFPGASLQHWHGAPRFWLIIAMFCGGMAGSTAGGFKLLRVVTLFKGLQWGATEAASSPHELVRYRLDGRALTRDQADERVKVAAIVFTLWIVTLACGVLALLHALPAGTRLDTALFDAVSALDNVGLSTGLAVAHMDAAAKVTLCVLMWLGRLEIVPVMVVLTKLLGRR